MVCEAAAPLPRTLAELRDRWRELPPSLKPEQVIEAGWFGLSKPAFYRACNAGTIPAIHYGRAWRLITSQCMRQLGIDVDDRPVGGVPDGRACAQACRPPEVHGEDEE